MYFCDQKVIFGSWKHSFITFMFAAYLMLQPGVNKKIIVAGDQTLVKVFRIPEFKMLNSADNNSFSDLITVYLKVFDHFTWNF